MLFEHASTMVKRFPNDPSNRFKLGVALFSRGDYTEALSELQQSQRNPRFKAQAGRLMGQCFHQRGQIDMAIDQYNTVLAELPVMNEDKKETLYCLANALTDQGKGEEGVKIFKEIFQADVSFKDVDARINAFYDSQKA
jgi:tetratricopeptide (TPR) repeat protein